MYIGVMRRVYYYLNSNEFIALLISIIAVALIFTGFKDMIIYGIGVLMINLTITLPAFAIHELAHRFIARRYGCKARYFIDPFGLTVSLFTFFLPFRLIALGYVGVSCPHAWYYGASLRFIEGRIAVAGPLSNIILSITFYALYNFMPGDFSAFILYRLYKLNAWLALFNLLPFPPLDGYKVFRYSPLLSLMLIAASLVLFIL